MNISEKKLISNIEECNIHIQRMLRAFTKISGLIPLNWEKFTNLNENEIEHIDQLMFRFSKLQDVIGEKLFRNIMTSISEDSRALTFIDILNRLEALGLLWKDDWLNLRKIRNLISHEYPEEKFLAMDNLNNLFKNIQVIYTIFISSRDFIFEKIIFDVDKNKYMTVVFPDIPFPEDQE